MESAGHLMRPGKFLENTGSGVGTMINSDIASAMRRWQRTPSEIMAGAPKPNAMNAVRQSLALPPATNAFHIDPSAGELYGQPTAADRLRSITRTPAEPGEGIPMRDVTPPKAKLLNPAPAKITTYIQRSSGKVFEMPAPVKALLDKFVQGRRQLSPMPPKQLTAASALRDRVFNMGGEVPPDIVEELTQENMNVFADLQESGIGETTGKLKRQINPEMMNAGEELKQRMGGFKADTVFKNLPYGPKQIAEAIRRGKGKVYDEIKAVAREAAKDQAEQYLEKQRATNEKFMKDTADWNVD